MSLPFISSQNASAVAAQNFLKSKNVGADAYAGATNFQSWWEDPSAKLLSRDSLEIAVNIIKIGEAIVSLIREIPVLGTALNVTSLGINLTKLKDALELAPDSAIDQRGQRHFVF